MATAVRTGTASRRRSLLWRVRRLIPLLALLVLGAVSWHTGLLRLVDLRAQQLALYFVDAPVAESRQLLVISPDDDNSPDAFASVVTQVAELKPRFLIITAQPPPATRTSLAPLRKRGDIVVGQQLAHDAFDGSSRKPVITSNAHPHYPRVILGHTRDVHGLHEGQYAWFESGDGKLDTPISALAMRDGRDAKDFRINFANALERIPRISWSRVLDGGLIGELVTDRVVLVVDPGYLHSAAVSSLAGASTPRAMLDALALDTWLEESDAAQLPGPFFLAILFALLLVGLFVFQWFSYQQSIRTTVWCSLLFGIGAPLALVYLNLDLSGSLMIMAVTFASLTVLYSKLQTEDEEFRRVLLSASLSLQEQQKSAANRRSGDPWEECQLLVSQIFTGQRFALLSIDGRGRKIERIILHRAEQGDVEEQRRDVRRAPFADAIAQRRPLEITVSESWRPFFKPADNERQLIVALQGPNESYGFLVVGVSERFQREHPDTDELVRNLAVRASDLLRTNAESENNQSTSALDYLQLKGGRMLSRTVARMGEAVRSRLGDLENLFDQLGTATVVYDLFGNVIYSNQRMSRLFESTELKPYQMPAAELLAGLTRLSVEEAKTRIRDAIVMEELTQLEVTVDIGGPGTKYYVNVRSVREASESDNLSGGSLDTAGVLFEIVDLAGTQRVGKSRLVLTKHLDYELRTRLGSLMMATAMLKDESIAGEHRQMLIDQLSENIDRATALLDESQDLLHSDESATDVEKAADPAEIVDEVVAHVKQIYEDSNVQLTVEKPDLAFLVRGDIDALVESLKLVLQILVRDTAEEGEVHFIAEQQANEFSFITRNQGFGMPIEQFKAYLSGEDQSPSKEFRDLRSALKRVQSRGTRVQATSSVAKGMIFKFTVPRVMSDDTAN